MVSLDRRLNRLEQAAGLQRTARGPYSPAWKDTNLPPDDDGGFRQLWAELWGQVSPEQQAAIVAGSGAMQP